MARQIEIKIDWHEVARLLSHPIRMSKRKVSEHFGIKYRTFNQRINDKKVFVRIED